MRSVSSRIWTRVAVSISYNDNHYTTGTAIVVVSILLYGCTTWTLAKWMQKLDGKNTKILRAILYKSWMLHFRKQLLCSHFPSISKTIQEGQRRHARHSWCCKDKLLRDVFLWTPLHEPLNVGLYARTFIRQLYVDSGLSLEDLPGVIDDWNV